MALILCGMTMLGCTIGDKCKRISDELILYYMRKRTVSAAVL